MGPMSKYLLRLNHFYLSGISGNDFLTYLIDPKLCSSQSVDLMDLLPHEFKCLVDKVLWIFGSKTSKPFVTSYEQIMYTILRISISIIIVNSKRLSSILFFFIQFQVN